MLFGNTQPELLPGAKNAVETCLAVQPGEQVALIADEASSAVAASSVDRRRPARLPVPLPLGCERDEVRVTGGGG